MRPVEFTADAKPELTPEAIVEVLRKQFDRSFSIKVYTLGGKVRIIGHEQDSGGNIMTVSDVAALCHMERDAIRRMTKQRAQKSMAHPIPFFKVGSLLRFRREAIMSWLDTLAAQKPVFAPPKRRRAVKAGQ